MLRDVSRYKLALLLAAIFAVAQIAFVVHVAMTAQQIAVSVLSFIGVVILLGLWLCSPFVRYAGAVYLVLWSAMILWSWFATGVAWTGVPVLCLCSSLRCSANSAANFLDNTSRTARLSPVIRRTVQ